MENSDLGFAKAPQRSFAKILSIAALIVALLSCAASAYLYVQWHTLAEEKKGFEATKVQLQDQVSALRQELESAEKEKEDLKTQLEEAVKAKQDQEQAIADNAKQLEQAKTDLNAAKKEVAAMKKQLENSAVADEVVLGGGDSVSGPSDTIIKTGPVGSNVPAMKIKTVNRKFNFVVVSTPPNSAPKAGDALRVERNGRWVADLTVQKTYDQFASAAVKKESEKDTLQIGDTVKAA